jgi:predicted XRE-type DNA-binding protein
MARRKNEQVVTPSSGNVFNDLGFEDADEQSTKVKLAFAINEILADMTQNQAAKALGVNQPKVSALLNYRLDGFSVERLMHFLTALDRDVEIFIRRKPARARRSATIKVTDRGHRVARAAG